ncbi:DNA repair protein RecN (Recombination protein N) [Breznakia sp. PF5-3]|uniref:DNA repair protein RecN n=1 Tax=unclassified Breznakia TaxID=2623764 RepID=UPI0024051F91|nr:MULTISPECIES: DNA repair protein RecN [unclassified Breznakia]MDF9823914.1 DNA repair protein RecN (Recombination protein N) [Breznakia sp. PM6-1]MDF9834713.1 DNA repair protein RecN (Recombination protein N) [Breznakia sp. PF5-3]MDF9836852.1 DNA repair protein RecN (Recombination protein N) [Breznakia sp. PFB2-8]MDF9858869.1 DNA repair protein RecN (Recombination protein N) [Breznakia sp. PH5-24]
MIRNMYVKNFVLIDELHLDFHSSFSCFTGETGAGKSLFIDALSILCGARVSSSYIQKGAEKAFIEAMIDISNSHPSYFVLKEAGYEVEDEYIVISREFAKDGKSVARINGRVCTVSLVKEILSDIIDIHSQHDSQYLLNSKNHLSLLDSFTNDFELLHNVKSAYQKYRDYQKELEEILEEQFNLDDLEFYQFQLQEIDTLDVKDGEIEELEQIQKEMGSFEKISSKLQNAIQLIESSNYENLYTLQKELDEIENDTVQKVKEEFINAYYIVEERFEELKQYTNSLEYDEDRFNQVQERLYEINKLIRKHGNSWDDVLKKADEIQTKISRMKDRDKVIEEKKKNIDKAYNEFYEVSVKMREKRKKAAKILEVQIKEELHDLHLENADFKIDFKENDSRYGIDQVEFYISMNRGEDLRPLAKVISGGELSRLMLGLKVIFSKLQHIQTIVFDEIDTGVSGNVAYAIGKKMKKLANDTQVFSITHLAPVAAWGDYHYLVEKEEKDGKTISSIHQLDEQERIHELASIASNSNSEQALNAARELYDSCRNDT